MPLVLKTAATTWPVSLSEAKSHLRVDISDDDALIHRQIKAIVHDLERRYNTAFITQTWTLYLDNWPGLAIELPRFPLQSVTSVKYTPYGGVAATFSSDSYTVDTYTKPGRVVLDSRSAWPGDELEDVNGIAVEFVAGYGNAENDVPDPIRQAILLILGNWYENRETLIVGAKFANAPDLNIDRLLMMNYREFHF